LLLALKLGFYGVDLLLHSLHGLVEPIQPVDEQAKPKDRPKEGKERSYINPYHLPVESHVQELFAAEVA